MPAKAWKFFITVLLMTVAASAQTEKAPTLDETLERELTHVDGVQRFLVPKQRGGHDRQPAPPQAFLSGRVGERGDCVSQHWRGRDASRGHQGGQTRQQNVW